MNAFYRYDENKGKGKISPALLWDYNLKAFDWQSCRSEVVKRIVELGRLEDFFAAFDLYGGIEGVREIAKNEVRGLSDRNLDFMCQAFNLQKENTLCYKIKQSRAKRLGF